MPWCCTTPSPGSGLLSTCEHQCLQDVRQGYNPLDHIILIHHYKSVNLHRAMREKGMFSASLIEGEPFSPHPPCQTRAAPPSSFWVAGPPTSASTSLLMMVSRVSCR